MTTSKSCNEQAGGCGRTQEPVGGGRWRPIQLNAAGLCIACVQAGAEARLSK